MIPPSVMDVVDSEREDGRTNEDDGYALNEVEGPQARDEELGGSVRNRRSIRGIRDARPTRSTRPIRGVRLARGLTRVSRAHTVGLTRLLVGIRDFQVSVVLRVLARHKYHVS